MIAAPPKRETPGGEPGASQDKTVKSNRSKPSGNPSPVNPIPAPAPLYFGGTPDRMGWVQALPYTSFQELVILGIESVPVRYTRKEFHALPKAERDKVKAVTFVVAATFKDVDSRRHGPLATTCNVLFVDVDDSVEAKRMITAGFGTLLGDLGSAVWHTASSTPEAPRLRVMVRIDDIPAASYGSAVESLAARLGMASVTHESKVPVQAMYLPIQFQDEPPQPLLYEKPEGCIFQPVGLPNLPDKLDPSDLSMGDITFLRAPLDDLNDTDLRAALGHIDPDCRMQQWVETGMALKHQLGDAGLEVWDEWSARGEKYGGRQEIEARWKSFAANPGNRHPITARSILKRAVEGGWQNPKAGGSGWAPPIPYEIARPPSLDLGQVIPSSLGQFRDYVLAAADEVQTTVEAVALLCLAIASAAAGRSFEIRLLQQWYETAVLWVVLLAEPGDRKSALLSKLSEPLYGWQFNENSRLAGPLAAYREQRCILEARLVGLRRKISSPTTPNALQLQTSAVAIAQQLESTPELHQPDLITADCTPEALRTLLVRNGEKVGLVSAETDFQQLTGSRYSKDGGLNINLMLAGKTGDALPGHRVTRSEPLRRPAIACALFVQPAAMRDVFRDANANGRGLVQRFIIVHPASRMGFRSLTPPPVPSTLSDWWAQTVRGILDFPWPGKVIMMQGSLARCTASPQILDLDPAAHAVFSALRQDIEDRLKDDGDLRPVSGFASKLPGDIARIALCLELMQNSSATVVTGATMTAACNWAEFLIAHHKAALGQASERPERRHARRLIASLGRNPVVDLTSRDVFRRLQNTTDLTTMADLQPVLADLVATNHIRPIPAAKPEVPGHPSSQRYEVNPLVYL